MRFIISVCGRNRTDFRRDDSGPLGSNMDKYDILESPSLRGHDFIRKNILDTLPGPSLHIPLVLLGLL